MGSPVTSGSAGSTSTSEWAPQPWSRLTTRPSEGDQALAHTPKKERSAPAIGRKYPHVEHGSDAFSATSECGPLSPSYQRWAAASRPSADSTRLRPSPSSNSATSSTSSSPVASNPCTSSGSSSLYGSTSPAPRSPGARRSAYGSHCGDNN